MYNFLEELTKEEIEELNKMDRENAEKEYNDFVSYYNKWVCYICKNNINNSENICLHSLLKWKSFKKKDFSNIYNQWWYMNIATFLRWVANQDRNIWNINDLDDEKWKNKKFEYSIKWKNIEWTFSCADWDYKWHNWTNADFPHYHFQMRINNNIHIKFSDFHIPFSEEDLFVINWVDNWKIKHSWNYWIWIQWVMNWLELMENNWINEMISTNDINEAQFHLQTIIIWEIKRDDILKIVEESKKTWKTMTEIAKNNGLNTSTIISPIESIPDIAKRTERKR